MPELLFEYPEPRKKAKENAPFESVLNKMINKSPKFESLTYIRSFMRQLLSALDKIHSVGAIHRDIKPSNMMIDNEGTLKVLDFDLSEFLDDRYELKYRVSTKGYKAPESMLSQKKYDYRFDVYSAGCVLAGILWRDSPFFEYDSPDEVWHSTALVWGVHELQDIDYNHVMNGMYLKRWRHLPRIDLYEEFKS